MSDVGGVQNTNSLAALQSAAQPTGRGLRVAPSSLTESQFAQKLASVGQRPVDSINFSQAAERLRGGHTVVPASPTYGINGASGLQATTPTAAREALSAAARQMVAARVAEPMDFVSGQAAARGGSMPFYTNPAMANSVATSTSAARAIGGLGLSIDATG